MDNLSSVLEALASAQFVDLSPEIASKMAGWSAHPDVTVVADARTHEADGYFCQVLLMPEHTGSHVDAPAHVLADRMDETVDTLPLDRLIGQGKKVDVRSLDLQAGELLTLEAFQTLADEQGVTIERDDIVLIDLGWDRFVVDELGADNDSRHWWSKNEPGFDEDLCAWLADTGVKAVGTNSAACDSAVADGIISAEWGHQKHFLPKGISILEGLVHLERVPGRFLFVATSLRIKDGSGSPIRALGVLIDR